MPQAQIANPVISDAISSFLLNNRGEEALGLLRTVPHSAERDRAMEEISACNGPAREGIPSPTEAACFRDEAARAALREMIGLTG